MEAFVTALTTELTPTAIWGAITPIAALVGALFLVAVSLFVARRVLSKGSRLKAGI